MTVRGLSLTRRDSTEPWANSQRDENESMKKLRVLDALFDTALPLQEQLAMAVYVCRGGCGYCGQPLEGAGYGGRSRYLTYCSSECQFDNEEPSWREKVIRSQEQYPTGFKRSFPEPRKKVDWLRPWASS